MAQVSKLIRHNWPCRLNRIVDCSIRVYSVLLDSTKGDGN